MRQKNKNNTIINFVDATFNIVDMICILNNLIFNSDNMTLFFVDMTFTIDNFIFTIVGFR